MITMYSASVPVFKQLLQSLNAILCKAEAHALNENLDPSLLLQARLSPDMYPLTRQIQIATDFAKGVTARLANMEVPVFEDCEQSIEELKARISKTLAFIESVSASAIDGSEAREIITRPGTPKEKRFTAENYLLHYGIPQFFFHVTTAYAILRNQGVAIGKLDFMGTY